MRLVYSDWETLVDFDDGGVWVVNCENRTYYSRIIRELISQKQSNTGRFILSKGDKVLDFSKSCEIILSPFSLDFENKKLITAFLKKICEMARDEEYVETQELLGNIMSYVYRLADLCDIDVTLNDEVDLTQLIKSTGIQLSRDTEDISSQFIDYMIILKNLLNIELFIGIDFKAYFSKEELMAIYEITKQKKIAIILLESDRGGDRIKGEKWLTIDADLCEI